jgi:hypothetical protein
MQFDWGMVLGIVGIALGLLALIVGVPPFIAMFWGGPRLALSLEQSDEKGGRFLLCAVVNKAVGNRFLRIMGVTRQSAHIEPFLDVHRAGKPEVVAAMIKPLLNSHSKIKQRIMELMPPFPASFNIAVSGKSGTFVQHPNSDKKTITLVAGDYRAEVTLVTDDRWHRIEGIFRVPNPPARAFWIDRNYR